MSRAQIADSAELARARAAWRRATCTIQYLGDYGRIRQETDTRGKKLAVEGQRERSPESAMADRLEHLSTGLVLTSPRLGSSSFATHNQCARLASSVFSYAAAPSGSPERSPTTRPPLLCVRHLRPPQTWPFSPGIWRQGSAALTSQSATTELCAGMLAAASRNAVATC
jgi:hypothetical protein